MPELFPTLDPQHLPAGVIVFGLLGMAVFLAGLLIDALLLARWLRRPPRWRACMARLRRRPWRAYDAAGLLAALLAGYSVFIVLAALDGGAGGAGGMVAGRLIVLQTVLLHGGAAAALVLLSRARRMTWRQAFGLEGAPRRVALRLAQGLAAYLAAMPPLVLLALLWRALLVLLDLPLEPQGAVNVFLEPGYPTWLRFYLTALAVLAAPVIEEMCFRGVMLPLLARRARATIAIAAVSTVFAAVHFHVPSLVPLFTIAAAFAVAYILTGSILVPIVMHAAFNSVSIAAILLLRDAFEAI